jgi:hypothetical protein
MTKKEKRTGARSEPAKVTAGKKDSIDNNNNSARDYATRIHPKEVFDSSKYNAMSDMSKGSNLETKNVEALADTQRTKNSMKPEQIDNKSITTTGAATSAVEEEEAAPKITPMMVEERAITIRELNEERTHQKLSSSSSSLSHQSGKEKKFILYLNIMLSIENAALERLNARIQQSPLAGSENSLSTIWKKQGSKKAGSAR